MAAVAKSVVYRHPCDCETASKPLAAGEKAEHRFDVDGAPFPWHITEAGATFTKRDDFYLVSVDLIPLSRSNNELLRVVLDTDAPPTFEHVDGSRTPFPWFIHGDITVRQDSRQIPIVELTFIAETVDTDTDVADWFKVPDGVKFYGVVTDFDDCPANTFTINPGWTADEVSAAIYGQQKQVQWVADRMRRSA